MFEIEKQVKGKSGLADAVVTVKNEVAELWEYAGFGDILHSNGYILQLIRSLHGVYKALNKTPKDKPETVSFKKKEVAFVELLPKLFDVAVKSLKSSNLITKEDQDF